MPLTWTLKQWLQTNRGFDFTTDRPLKNLKALQEIVKSRTGNTIPLRTLHSLLEKQPKTLDCRTLQTLCDAFACKLADFCSLTSSSPPVNLLNDLQIPLEPRAIADNETLYSFIRRVQMVAIEEAVSRSDTYAQAARRLGYNRTSLRTLHTRVRTTASLNQHPSRKGSQNRFPYAIPLPDDIFTISTNEHLQPFISRIQLTAILQTIKVEGNQTRAALRLGYQRTSLVTLFTRLQTRSKE